MVESVWKVEQDGRNWTGQEARIVTTATEFMALVADNTDALALHTLLRWKHGDGKKPFAISPKAMAEEQLIPAWKDHRRYANARDRLLTSGFLTMHHKGGKHPGDVSLFTLATPSAISGAGRDETFKNTIPKKSADFAI